MSGQGICNLTPSYQAVFYCSRKGVAHFVITREDSASPGVKGDDQGVLFEQSEITLDIPAEGVMLGSGWSITPLAASELTDEHTQDSSERVACFALRVKWTKPEEHPVKLCHRIKLLGAKPPGNFITLKIEPPSQPSLGAGGAKPTTSGKPMRDNENTEVLEMRTVKKKKLDNNEPAMPTLTQTAEQENERGGQRQGKRQRCGKCIGCQPIQKEDCSECPGCKDMPKFGGPGRRHQPCIYHECQLLKYVPKDPSKLPAPVQGPCGKCIGCFYNNFKKNDCGQCEACKSKKKFGGKGRTHKTCRYRECQKQKYTPKKPPEMPNPEGTHQAKIIAEEESPSAKNDLTLEKRAPPPKENPAVEEKVPPAKKKNPAAEEKASPPKRKNPAAEEKAPPTKRKKPATEEKAPPPKENPAAEEKAPPAKRENPAAEEKAPPAKRKNPAKEEKTPPPKRKNPAAEEKAPPPKRKNQAIEEKAPPAKRKNPKPTKKKNSTNGTLAQAASISAPAHSHQQNSDADVELTIDDLVDVTSYLLNLGSTHIYNLGLTLGLNQPHMKNMMGSQTFRDDMIAAWLQREDQVVRRGVPTWRTLVKALRDRRVNQIGVADKIAADKNVAE